MLPRDPGGVYRISRRTRISRARLRTRRNHHTGRPRTPRRVGLGFCIWHPTRLPDRRACIVPSRTERNGVGWISHRWRARKNDDRLGISILASAVTVPSWPISGISYGCSAKSPSDEAPPGSRSVHPTAATGPIYSPTLLKVLGLIPSRRGACERYGRSSTSPSSTFLAYSTQYRAQGWAFSRALGMSCPVPSQMP
jgi:hypothetical protein